MTASVSAVLPKAMLEAVNDPAERRARGNAARGEAQRRYTWSAIGAALAGELREIEAGAGAAPTATSATDVGSVLAPGS